MARRFEGKVVIVTGAGSVGDGIGNGKAAALLYAREGAKVALVDCNVSSAERTAGLISKEGGTCFPYQADVSRAEACRSIVEACVREYGRVDILHNNVGIEIPGGLSETSEEDWDRIMDVNLKSMFLLSKYAVPELVRQGGGAIVNISSINAIRTLPALSLAYAVSKAGVIALTREIAVEYADRGIRANAVLPGMMNTPFVRVALTEAWGGDVLDMMRRRDAMCPSGKQGESWDVAHVSAFLASDEARYVSGAAVVVDGGQTARIMS